MKKFVSQKTLPFCLQIMITSSSKQTDATNNPPKIIKANCMCNLRTAGAAYYLCSTPGHGVISRILAPVAFAAAGNIVRVHKRH